MKVTAMLCNHAETQNNFLYVSGAGIDQTIIPPGMPAPYPATFGIGLLIDIPWQATNQQHTMQIEMLDADGHEVLVPTGPSEMQALGITAEFNLGRPPGLATGDDQTMAFAVNFPSVPLPKLGNYQFRISVDGSVASEIRYKLVTMQTTMGFGPSSMPTF